MGACFLSESTCRIPRKALLEHKKRHVENAKEGRHVGKYTLSWGLGAKML